MLEIGYLEDMLCHLTKSSVNETFSNYIGSVEALSLCDYLLRYDTLDGHIMSDYCVELGFFSSKEDYEINHSLSENVVIGKSSVDIDYCREMIEKGIDVFKTNKNMMCKNIAEYTFRSLPIVRRKVLKMKYMDDMYMLAVGTAYNAVSVLVFTEYIPMENGVDIISTIEDLQYAGEEDLPEVRRYLCDLFDRILEVDSVENIILSAKMMTCNRG